jgi:hypothetical protein
MYLKKNESGSITLEAALILPIFMAFLIILITFIRLAMVQIDLKNTTAEATKELATHYYLVGAVQNELAGPIQDTSIGQTYAKVDNFINDVRSGIQDASLIADLFGINVDEIVTSVSEKIISEDLKKAFDSMVGSMGDKVNTAFEKYYFEKYFVTPDNSILNPGDLEVTRVYLPLDSKIPYVGIEVEYKYKIIAPFFQKELILREKSYERVWGAN